MFLSAKGHTALYIHSPPSLPIPAIYRVIMSGFVCDIKERSHTNSCIKQTSVKPDVEYADHLVSFDLLSILEWNHPKSFCFCSFTVQSCLLNISYGLLRPRSHRMNMREGPDAPQRAVKRPRLSRILLCGHYLHVCLFEDTVENTTRHVM